MAVVRRMIPAAIMVGLSVAGCSAGTGEREVVSDQDRGGAAVPVSGHPDPLTLVTDADPALEASKRLVFDMWRSIVNAGQVQLADRMLREDYIQHSPVLPTGREGFKSVFSAVPRTEIPDTVSPALVALVAEGDLVVMALAEEQTEPSKARYTTTHFNLFRVEGGQLAEHWHSVEAPPGPDVPAANEGGPQPVTGAIGAEQLAMLDHADASVAANKRLVFDAWREVVEGGQPDKAARYFAANYIEHDPNKRSGLKGLLEGLPKQQSVRGSLAGPLVAMVGQGDLVVIVTGHTHSHPTRQGASYTTTRFDMVRIEDGRIAEHWSGLGKPGGVPAFRGN